MVQKYSVHAKPGMHAGLGWLFVIGGGLKLLAWRRPKTPALFTARAIASIIIMIWTVLAVRSFAAQLPGWSAVPIHLYYDRKYTPLRPSNCRLGKTGEPPNERQRRMAVI